MDLNTMRVIVTVATFICFVAIVIWAYSRRREKQFDEAAQLPFADETAPAVLAAPPAHSVNAAAGASSRHD